MARDNIKKRKRLFIRDDPEPLLQVSVNRAIRFMACNKAAVKYKRGNMSQQAAIHRLE
jgi:hypothetical protein